MPELDDVIRDISAQSKASSAAFTAAVAPIAGGVKNALMTLPIGTPVLDLVTGEQGVVINGKRENVVIPAA